MVIIVYAEGGILNGNNNAATMGNNAALREELNRFMSEALQTDDIQVVVKTSAGYKSAAAIFVNSQDLQKFLYVDLDRKPELREDWFTDIDNEGITIEDDLKDRVFFWIQEMEAWFLKQPEALEEWAADEGFERKTKFEAHLSEHPAIKNKDIERLQHKPSRVLADMLKQTFNSSELDKRNRPIAVKYGKLKHAPGILSHLDVEDLISKDLELQNFIHYIGSMPH